MVDDTAVPTERRDDLVLVIHTRGSCSVGALVAPEVYRGVDRRRRRFPVEAARR